MPLIVQPRAVVIEAKLGGCSTYSMAGTILIYLAIIFCIHTIHSDLLLGMLELVVLPLHVEVWKEEHVEIGCPHFRVLLKTFEFLYDLFNV